MCSKACYLGISIILSVSCFGKAALPSLVIVIRSQSNSYHAAKAERLEQNLTEQIEEANLTDVEILQLHKRWGYAIDRAWAIIPELGNLWVREGWSKNWILFIEDETSVKVEKLLRYLSDYDPKDPLFLGHGIYDSRKSPLHENLTFTSMDGTGPFLFPLFQAGWVISNALLHIVVKDVAKTGPTQEPAIDLPFEVGKYIFYLGYELKNLPHEFCEPQKKNTKWCLTTTSKDLPKCGNKIGLDDIFFGVKTTEKFHKTRVKAVLETWGRKVKHLQFYSNVTDLSKKIISTGVPNAEFGHCAKTDMILKDFLNQKHRKDVKFFVLTDDDTTLSVARLIKVLNCYDPEEPLLMGDKYGYTLNYDRGYGYIAGGGGMVFTFPAIEAWLEQCNCPSLMTSDDKFVAQCIYRTEVITTTHSPLFHQGRPQDYPEGYLSNQYPVSFHGHVDMDHKEVYRTWFEEADSKLESSVPKTEL